MFGTNRQPASNRVLAVEKLVANVAQLLLVLLLLQPIKAYRQ